MTLPDHYDWKCRRAREHDNRRRESPTGTHCGRVDLPKSGVRHTDERSERTLLLAVWKPSEDVAVMEVAGELVVYILVKWLCIYCGRRREGKYQKMRMAAHWKVVVISLARGGSDQSDGFRSHLYRSLHTIHFGGPRVVGGVGGRRRHWARRACE